MAAYMASTVWLAVAPTLSTDDCCLAGYRPLLTRWSASFCSAGTYGLTQSLSPEARWYE